MTEDSQGVPDLTKGRNKVAGTIVVAHAVKHVYGSGQSSLIMPEISIDLGLTRSQFGFLNTASAVAWWSSTMISGYLGDRFSNRAGLMLAISLCLMGVSLFLAGLAPNYTTMLGVMFLVGIGPSMFHPPAIGELSRRFPDRRGFAVSLHGMAANVGEVLGPLTVAGFLTVMIWRDLLKAGLVPALLVALVVWIMMPSRKADLQTEVTSVRKYFLSLVGLLHNRMLLLLIAATAIRSMGEGGVGAFLTLYMRDELKYSVTAVAVFLSAAQVAGIVSQPLMGYLSDKVGRKPVLVVGTGLMMLSAFAMSVAKTNIQLFPIVLVRGALSFSLHHIFVAAALDAARGVAQSTVVSLIYGAGFLGTVSPYIAGRISDAYGIPSAFVYSGVVMIIPTIMLAVARFPKSGDAFDTEAEQANTRVT
ncbi:MFS transporter [Dehalococcoidia bacterium]|mgnify:CR=1 FL=1|nr:MFS transporter [Dehalococcoidia bacterium]